LGVESGVAYTWGEKYRGVLGRPEEDGEGPTFFPTQVAAIEFPLHSLSIGDGHALALTEKTDGYLGVMSWFFANDYIDEPEARTDQSATPSDSAIAYTLYSGTDASNYAASSAAQVELYAYGEVEDAAAVELPVLSSPSTYTPVDQPTAYNPTSYSTVEMDSPEGATVTELKPTNNDSQYGAIGTSAPTRGSLPLTHTHTHTHIWIIVEDAAPQVGHVYQYNSTESLPDPEAATPSSLHIVRTSADQLPVTATWRNWNEEFQTLLSLPIDTVENKLRRMRLIADFYDEFIAKANAVSKIIVTEATLPLEQKTYRPLQIGGIAGGEKYIVDGIFFKFAVDLHGIYGGDEWSRKGLALTFPLLFLINSCWFSCQFGIVRIGRICLLSTGGARLALTLDCRC